MRPYVARKHDENIQGKRDRRTAVGKEDKEVEEGGQWLARYGRAAIDSRYSYSSRASSYVFYA